MKNIEIYNTLNIDKDSSSIVATFTQEDDAVMEFKLFKDGQEIVLKDQTISLGAERKDGAVIEQDDGFLIKENNVLNITLKKNIIQVVGVVKIQLYLKDKSGEMASNTFNIRVNKKLLGAENVEATNDIKSLNTLVLELKNNTNRLIDDTKAKADKLLSGLQGTGDNLSATVKAKTDKVIEDTKAEVDNIKKDYEGLKKVVIDENIGIKLQKDVTELKNGLKSNQSLEYSGSSINANNTLEGRTEGMVIRGKTSIVDGQLKSFGEAEKVGEKYKISILSHNESSKKQDKKDILIKEPLRENDILYEDNEQVKVYRPMKQYTFTGDENFQEINVYGDVVRIDFACSDIKPSGYIISNNFEKGVIGKENLECINIHANSKYVQFQIKLNKLNSPYVEGFKAWLKSNPTTIVYQLDTPTVEIVENCVDIDLDTYQEKTYFSISNSLQGTLDFKVPSNIASIVQANSKAINEIYDLIDKLILPNILQNTTDIEILKLEKLK